MAWKESLDVYEPLAREHESIPLYQFLRARALENLSLALRALNLREDADRAIERLTPLLERLVREHPDVVEYRLALGGHLLNEAADLQSAKNTTRPSSCTGRPLTPWKSCVSRRRGWLRSRSFSPWSS